jgi:hypothetical protein
MVTLQSIIKAAREMAYDRFPMPILYLRTSLPNYIATVDSLSLKINEGTTLKYEFLFSQYEKVSDIFEALLVTAPEIGVALTASYVGDDPSSSLVKFAQKPISGTSRIALYRRYGVPEVEVIQLISDYAIYYYRKQCSCAEAADIFISKLKCPSDRHLTIWLAYHLVDKLRAFFAAQELEIVWTNDEEGFCAINAAGQGFIKKGSLSISVADVFSFSDEETKPPVEKVEQAGNINFWGDDGFWYRLQMKLRGMFEKLFFDFSLQPSQVVFSQMMMDKDATLFAWFDSFPYEISTLTQEIINSCKE